MSTFGLAVSQLLVAATMVTPPQPSYPSPCDRYEPTGEKLPRQDMARGNTYLTAEPNPTWRSRRIATVLQDEPVTILQECGYRLRVRTVRGEEGWIGTVMLPAELRLLEAARKRPPARDADCARRFLDERLIRQCQSELAVRQAYETELRTAPLLTAAEIPAFVSGHTLVMVPRVEESFDDLKHPPTMYFTAEGEVFLRFGQGFKWRGRWTVEQDTLCLPGSAMSCVRFRRRPDGRMVLISLGDRKEYFITRTGGDSAGLVTHVSESYPNPTPPPAPKGSEPFARPSLGGY